MKRGVLALLRLIVRLLFRYRIHGLSELDLSGKTIIMPNHVSLIDGVLLSLSLPDQTVFVINTEIAGRFNRLLLLANRITVDPMNPYSVRRMVRAVNDGVPLVIFPEGRISRTGGLMKIYPGVGYVALKTGAKLIPVAIDGAERTVFSYMAAMWRTRLFTRVEARIGQPFRLQRDPARPLKPQKAEASDSIYKALQDELLRLRLQRQPGANLFDRVLDAARVNGSKLPILRDTSRTLTYKQLLLACYALARKLDGMLPDSGGRVGLLLPNAAALPVALLALFRLGLAPAMLNYTAGAAKLVQAAETAGLRFVLTSREFAEKAKLAEAVARLAEHTSVIYLEDVRAQIGTGERLGALLDYTRRRGAATGAAEVVLFTSGSESAPKGVVLGHDQIWANVQQCRGAIDFTSRDLLLNALPMFHSFGLTVGALLPLLVGMPVYLYPNPLHYRIVPELVYDKLATILLGTSTFLAGYARYAHPYDFNRLRYVVAGGEKLKDEVRRVWMDRFGIRILEGYGATETAPVLSLNTPQYNRAGSVGRLLPGIDWRLEPVDGLTAANGLSAVNGLAANAGADGSGAAGTTAVLVGRLLVRGPNVMKGYLLHGRGFAAASEWYDTGDVVRMDEHGYVHIVARLKRFAKIGGEMVSLQAVEEAVAETVKPRGIVAAVALSDARKGERIVLVHEDPSLSPAELRRELAASGCPPLLVPASLLHLEAVPLLGSGKVDYVALREQVSNIFRQA